MPNTSADLHRSPCVILSSRLLRAQNLSSLRLSLAARRCTRWTAPLLALAVVLFSVKIIGAREPQRPKIYGISDVTILTSDIPKAREFYLGVSDPGRSCDWCEESPSSTLKLSSGQIIELKELPSPAPSSLLEEIAFRTDNLDRLASYLKARGVELRESRNAGRISRISLIDPEGHHIAFLGETSSEATGLPKSPAGARSHIIHAGIVVHDRAAEDHFYKEILGFHVYWHGGMKDDETNWVDMQVPDGTDWIEYMLNVPADASHRTLGVMNHIALGVPDIHAAEQQLLKNGMKLTEEPKLGRDGKWQLNLYDPDQTRVELMEFTPSQKPCCSEYTGPHPKP